jgi:hypothetical protein
VKSKDLILIWLVASASITMIALMLRVTLATLWGVPAW